MHLESLITVYFLLIISYRTDDLEICLVQLAATASGYVSISKQLLLHPAQFHSIPVLKEGFVKYNFMLTKPVS